MLHILPDMVNAIRSVTIEFVVQRKNVKLECPETKTRCNRSRTPRPQNVLLSELVLCFPSDNVYPHQHIARASTLITHKHSHDRRRKLKRRQKKIWWALRTTGSSKRASNSERKLDELMRWPQNIRERVHALNISASSEVKCNLVLGARIFFVRGSTLFLLIPTSEKGEM